MKIPSLKNLDSNVLKVVLGIYVPGFFIQLGSSLTAPFNPLYSRELGADIGMIGLIAAAGGIGQVIFDLPGGWMAGKIKEKPFLIFSVAIQVICIFLKALAQTPLQIFFINMIIGMSMAAWGIGRLAYMRKRIPAELRGRSLAFMGGIMRVTRIISPVLGGLLIKFFGFRLIYFIQGGLASIALFSTVFLIEGSLPQAKEEIKPHHVLKETFKNNGRNIVFAMLGITGLQLLRMSRNLLLPLWADHIGISVEIIGGLNSAGGLIETLMVIPAGIVLDRYGRKWAAVPCTIGMGIALALLPLTAGVLGLAVITLLMSLTNGIGSGINMTISSDLAPKRAAAEFLGIWRFVTDSSQILGPSIAGVIAQVFALALAPVVLGGMGIGAGLILLFGMKETGKLRQSRES